jgi:hypothetical protein
MHIYGVPLVSILLCRKVNVCDVRVIRGPEMVFTRGRVIYGDDGRRRGMMIGRTV